MKNKILTIDAAEILKQHKLKNTGCRKHIISELLKSEGSALSENEMKEALPELFDRVTFYRSLKTLEENNIIHRIVLHDATVKYALNAEKISSHEHAHFHCVACDQVICMDEPVYQPVSLPRGFSVASSQVLLEGKCPQCSQHKK